MQETTPAVRRRTVLDIQSENAVREREAASAPQRHRYWAMPESSEEANAALVGELDGRIVGRCLAEAVYPPFGELQNMNVALPFRGRGVGLELVDACLRDLTRRGCMAVFLQTDANNVTAQRLYARRGFFPVARGGMLRLLRFTNLPLWDEFMHMHPLSAYAPPASGEGRRWPARWIDWVTGDELTLVLTGGSSGADSDGYGPGLAEAAMRSELLSFQAALDGPASASSGEAIELAFTLANHGGAPLEYSTRLLVPPGMNPTGQWDRLGPHGQLGPGDEISASLGIQTVPETDSEVLRRKYLASFCSLPLTLEVFVGPTSFWLTQQVIVPARS